MAEHTRDQRGTEQDQDQNVLELGVFAARSPNAYSPVSSPIHVIVRQTEGEFVIQVRDHGPGISPPDLPHLAPYVIDAITNGVHATTWVSPPFRALFDRHLLGWQENNLRLRNALNIPRADVRQAHAEVKRELIEYVNRETNVGMDVHLLTLGFARRATA